MPPEDLGAGELKVPLATRRRISLGGTAVRGMVILGLATATESAAQLVRAFVLARLLVPEDFGLMGMALVFVLTAETLSQTGFYRALVQMRGDPAAVLDTVWTLSALRGIALFAIAWLLAPLAGEFFGTPMAVPVLRAAAVGSVIMGLLNPAYFLLEREFVFIRYAAPRTIGILFEFVASVALSYVLRSVWGMLLGFLAGKVVFVALSYMVRPYRPSIAIRKDHALELYRYGRHIFRATIADCIVGQGDKAVVGRLLGAGPLGLYSMASRLASLPSTGLYDVVYRIAFPVFSHIQEDVERLRAGFLRALRMMSACALPIATGLWIVADDLIPALLGENWMGVVPSLRALCAGGACMGLFNLLRGMLGGIGRPDVAARGTYLLLVLFAVPLYPAAVTWGSVGAAWCSTAAFAAAMIHLLWNTSRLIRCPLRVILGALTPSALASAAMLAADMALGPLVADASHGSALGARIVAGACSYILVLLGADRMMGSELLTSLTSAWRSFARRAGEGEAGLDVSPRPTDTV